MTSENSVRKKLANIAGAPMTKNVTGELKIKTFDKRTFVQSICDLIDNSIDGKASTIEIIHRPTTFLEKDAYAVSVIDDGVGIKPEDMHNCISLSTRKDEGYESWKLGAFGIGLKDASFAQAHEVTLISKRKGGSIELRRLSSMFIKLKDEWKVLSRQEVHDCDLITKAIKYAEDRLSSMESGTAVIWEDMHSLADKIILKDEAETKVRIDMHEEKVREYVSMTFANFLGGIDIGPRVKEKPLTIKFNNNELKPLDPFLKADIKNQGTLMKPYDFDLYFPTSDNSYPVTINRYILPKDTKRERRYPDYDNRMRAATDCYTNDLQGIYYYRNGRLLDGPWNGQKWRINAMGMGDSHFTVARWEVVLPSEISNEPSLLDPSKTGVITTQNLAQGFLAAKNERIIWLEPDDRFPYGYINKSGTRKIVDLSKTGTKEGVLYSKRAKTRGDGHDVAAYCSERGCVERVLHQGDKCKSCTRNYCPYCDSNRVDKPGECCDDCEPPRCTHSLCDEFVEAEGTRCKRCEKLYCHSPTCEIVLVQPTSFCSACGVVGEGQRIGFESKGEDEPFYRIDEESGDTWINTTHPDFAVFKGRF